MSRDNKRDTTGTPGQVGQGSLDPVPLSRPAVGEQTSRENDIDHLESWLRTRRPRAALNVRRSDSGGFVTAAKQGQSDARMFTDMADAMGTTSSDFTEVVLADLLTYFGADDEKRATKQLNAALAVMDGVEPENEVEAMLLAQMVVAHDSSMRCMALVATGTPAATETFGNLSVKLMRTFTAQVEALAKLRRKGEQTVKVVHVYPGGQAVVGDVHHHQRGGGGTKQTKEQPDATGDIGARATLPCPDTSGDSVPIASDEERPMSHARRRKPRRADG